jgi:hypothetical protein
VFRLAFDTATNIVANQVSLLGAIAAPYFSSANVAALAFPAGPACLQTLQGIQLATESSLTVRMRVNEYSRAMGRSDGGRVAMTATDPSVERVTMNKNELHALRYDALETENGRRARLPNSVSMRDQ